MRYFNKQAIIINITFLWMIMLRFGVILSTESDDSNNKLAISTKIKNDLEAKVFNMKRITFESIDNFKIQFKNLNKPENILMVVLANKTSCLLDAVTPKKFSDGIRNSIKGLHFTIDYNLLSEKWLRDSMILFAKYFNESTYLCINIDGIFTREFIPAIYSFIFSSPNLAYTHIVGSNIKLEKVDMTNDQEVLSHFRVFLREKKFAQMLKLIAGNQTYLITKDETGNEYVHC